MATIDVKNISQQPVQQATTPTPVQTPAAPQKKTIAAAQLSPQQTSQPQKKQGLLHDFFVEDISNVWDYVFKRLMLPTAKRLIVDTFSQGFNMWLNGGVPSHSEPTMIYKNYNAQYNNQYQQYQPPQTQISRTVSTEVIQPRSRARSARFNLGDITWDSVEEAQQIFDYMQGQLDTYNVVSVRDFLEAADMPYDPQDERFGWFSLNGTTINKLANGKFYLNPPPTVPIKN
jgi:hypothetical protein